MTENFLSKESDTGHKNRETKAVIGRNTNNYMEKYNTKTLLAVHIHTFIPQ